MIMVYVPAGEFQMGSTDADINAVLTKCSDCKRDWYTDEQPQHAVRLDAFWIDRTEVTNAQYQKCVDAGACRVADMPLYDPQGRPNHPVVEITWNDAQVYCRWAGARLPTEAEWAKAARGTAARTYPWGDDMPDCNKAQYRDCGGQTVPVGSRAAGASPYGALDMAGNAWEWVADWYGRGYYADSPANDPKGPESGEYRVLRGGSWYDGWYYIRGAIRDPYSPSDRHFNVGFRCVGSP
jgi:formylglycine-generating enzyme required for sulfatase activity